MARKPIIVLAFVALLLSGVIVLAPAPALVQADSDPPGPGCGTPTQAPLIAGKKLNAGTIDVWADASYLYVRFSPASGWLLSETHLAVATSLNGIPQTKTGNPVPGKFPYKARHRPSASEFTYVLPRGTWTSGSLLYVAAHASLFKVNGKGKVVGKEGGWAGTLPFPGKNWATYFTFSLPACGS